MACLRIAVPGCRVPRGWLRPGERASAVPGSYPAARCVV